MRGVVDEDAILTFTARRVVQLSTVCFNCAFQSYSTFAIDNINQGLSMMSAWHPPPHNVGCGLPCWRGTGSKGKNKKKFPRQPSSDAYETKTKKKNGIISET